MKTKVILASLFLSLAFVSCKNEDKKDGDIIKKEEVKPETFDVSVNLTIKKDDDLILYYKDGSNEWFDEEHAVWMGVKGNEQPQTVVLSLPEGSMPIDIRLDLGRNEYKNQDPIAIHGVKLSFLDKSFEINEHQILDFFNPNQYLKFDEVTKKFILQKDEKGGYDPFLESKNPLYPQLLGIARGN